MEGLDPHTILVVIASFTGLGALFRILLNPVYFRLDKLERRMDQLEAGQARFDNELKEIKSKLDQLLAATEAKNSNLKA